MRCCFLYNMCMRKYKKKPWTMKEKGILLKYYYTLPKDELYEILPDRTPNAIRKQVLYLRSKGRGFRKNVSKNTERN